MQCLFRLLEHFSRDPAIKAAAGLAQSVERETLNLKVAGSTPAFGYVFWPEQFTILFADQNGPSSRVGYEG